MKPGFATFWNRVLTPEIRPVIFLSPSVETPMMLSFHNRHRTSRAFAVTAAVCPLYTWTERRFTFKMPCMFNCRRIRMSRYDVLLCVDMSKATKNVHASSSSSYTFCRFISQSICAYFEIVELLHAPTLASPPRYLVCCNMRAA